MTLWGMGSLALAFLHVNAVGAAGGDWLLDWHTLRWLHHLHGLHGNRDSGLRLLLGVS